MSSPPLPDRIGPYAIEHLLGEGGFGRVYAAQGPSGPVAVKVANRRMRELSSPELVLQENELEALTRLTHPGVVGVRQHGYTEAGELYLAMELVHGPSLEVLLEKYGRLDTVVVLGIVGKVAEALAHCHGLGVTHLDLKPDNIIVVDEHEPLIKILDFGLARMTRSWGGELMSIVGTPQYMPPERFDNATLDPRADLYALGVILYESLSGQPPFEDGPLEDMIAVKRAGSVIPLRQHVPSVPELLSQLVLRLLDPDPSRRPASAGEVVRMLKGTFHAALGGSADSAPHPALPDAPARAVGEVPFVGRSSELKELRGIFKASGESGQAVILVGPPGMGKSRMVTRLMSRSSTRHAMTAYGRCREQGGMVPFAPFREALGQLATRLAEQPASVLVGVREALRHEAVAAADLVPELRELVTSISGPPPAEHPPLPQALAALLRAVAASSPVILVIEDLHWADDAVLDLVTTLGLAPPPGLLLLATSRHDPQLPGVLPITLAPLPDEDNDRLIGELIGNLDPNTILTLKQRIPMLRRGNPMLATQVIHNLHAQRVLVTGRDGRVTFDEQMLGLYEPPDSIQEVLQRAVSQLDDDTRAILAFAAMVGRRFTLRVLDDIDVLSPARVTQALVDSERLGLCQVDRVRGEFVHDAIRAQLVADISEEHRIRIHKHIARSLRRLKAPPGTLAHHLEHSGDTLGAALAHLEAGTHAAALHDLRGANDHLRRALDLAGDLPASAVRSEVLRQGALDLVRNAAMLGATEDLMAYLDRCADRLGEGPHDVAAMSSAFARLYYVKGDFVQAVEHSRAALETAGDDPALARYRVVPVNILGRTLCASGHFGAAAKTLGEGCDLAREAGDEVELSHSLGMLGLSLGFTGDFEGARKYAELGASLAWAVDNPIRKAAAMFYASVIGEYAYDWNYGVAHAAEALRLAEEHRLEGLYLYLATMFAGRHQFHIGELGRAGALLEQALHLSRHYDVAMGVGWAHGFLGDVHFVLDDLDTAWVHYKAGAAAAERGAGDAYAAGINLMGRAAVAARRGDPIDPMRDDAEQALERLETADNRSALAYSLQRFAEALGQYGDRRAEVIMEQCHEAFESLGLRFVDWWPDPPSGAEHTGSNREYWQHAPPVSVADARSQFEDRVTQSFDRFEEDDDEEPTVQRPGLPRRLTAVLVSDAQEQYGDRPLAGGRRLPDQS